MKTIKGRLSLAKFRIQKDYTIGCWLIIAITLCIVCLTYTVKGNFDIPILSGILSFTSSMIGIHTINKVNKKYKADLNLIRTKHGLKNIL
jgi:hypothetical protein